MHVFWFTFTVGLVSLGSRVSSLLKCSINRLECGGKKRALDLREQTLERLTLAEYLGTEGICTVSYTKKWFLIEHLKYVCLTKLCCNIHNDLWTNSLMYLHSMFCTVTYLCIH